MFQEKENKDFIYTVTKIFGVDAVKTRVFRNEEDAEEDILENLKMCCEDETQYVIEERDNERYYIVNHSETDPTAYIEFVLRRCILR